MTEAAIWADLSSRAIVHVHGQAWRSFLQGLISQDVDQLGPGDICFAALLSPQGRLLFDLFIVGSSDGCMIDCAAGRRADLMQRLLMYRLRAKVRIEASELSVAATWDGPVAEGWVTDPRLPALGARGYGLTRPGSVIIADEAAYLDRCRRLGVPGPEDWGFDLTYPIEANFDLLGGISFKKGCFIGQETTSRMKRRGVIKNRMAPIAYDGPPPPQGEELLAGDLRAGVTRSAADGWAMALLRLDRVAGAGLTLADGRHCEVVWPDWLRHGVDA